MANNSNGHCAIGCALSQLALFCLQLKNVQMT
uniref:Uncharacterized protein n=1 Tax=Anguilla anguilla TaxID=7936 RepID=A0A0E9PJV1_ANGAN